MHFEMDLPPTPETDGGGIMHLQSGQATRFNKNCNLTTDDLLIILGDRSRFHVRPAHVSAFNTNDIFVEDHDFNRRQHFIWNKACSADVWMSSGGKKGSVVSSPLLAQLYCI